MFRREKMQSTGEVRRARLVVRHDIVLIGSMMVLAACGLIYEYLLAHYAGRIIGAMESSIYGMIGIMIVAMGIGAFLAKWIQNPFAGFAWLEVGIGFLGGSSILIMAGMIWLTYSLPQLLQEVYGLHPSMTLEDGIVAVLQEASFLTPFAVGFVLGVMIGMEIPLIARIREEVHGKHIVHNTGTIYGADYIGAGLGAAIWVYVCLKLPIMVAAIGTAGVNAFIGLIFLYRYQRQIRSTVKLWLAHTLLIAGLILLSVMGIRFTNHMNSALFKDQVIYKKVTPYQHITLTKRRVGKGVPTTISLYINGRLQFSSNDEAIYHSLLTYPPMLASARHENILVIGGGDGLAVRDILQWQPKAVTVIDLDQSMINLFSGNDPATSDYVREILLELNKRSFLDQRVRVLVGDAFVEVEKLVRSGLHYDTIIVDLPDPSHPDLNKLYSSYFYARLKELISGDGAIAIQSTSPYHSKKAFISIGKTLADAGFTTRQYHANVPTFGEWGWSIGTKYGKDPLQRIQETVFLPVTDPWISKAQLEAIFVFAPSFFQDHEEVGVNHLGSHLIYQYHHDAWEKEEGLYFTKD